MLCRWLLTKQCKGEDVHYKVGRNEAPYPRNLFSMKFLFVSKHQRAKNTYQVKQRPCNSTKQDQIDHPQKRAEHLKQNDSSLTFLLKGYDCDSHGNKADDLRNSLNHSLRPPRPTEFAVIIRLSPSLVKRFPKKLLDFFTKL